MSSRGSSPDAPAPRDLAWSGTDRRSPLLRIPETQGLPGLRLPRLEDVPAITACCQAEGIQRFTSVPSPYSEEDARRWVETCRDQVEAGEGLHLVLTDGDDRVVGAIGVSLEDRARVGYWLAPEARGRGWMTRALGAVVASALEEVEELDLECSVANPASQAVAERTGFVRRGLSEDASPDGRDAIVYARSRAAGD